MRNVILLRFLIFVSVLAFSTFLIGFGLAVKDLLMPTASPLPSLGVGGEKPSSEKDTLTIVSLGDSLTRGVGDGEGKGYVGRVVDRLKSIEKRKVSVTNLAVSGATSQDLIKQLSVPGVRYAISEADILFLTIGGNDLNPGFEKLDKMDPTHFIGDLSAFVTRGKKILAEIRDVNPDAPLFWLGLYNPFEDVLPGTNRTILAWNRQMEDLSLSVRSVYFVPLFDLFHQQTGRMLYSDHFHPNSKGYEAISIRLSSVLINVLGTGGGEKH
ncbi:MAG: lipase [Thermicanus sp.]|nr:lipase [Thermicanus sp.]